jgi:hypothetical protein
MSDTIGIARGRVFCWQDNSKTVLGKKAPTVLTKAELLPPVSLCSFYRESNDGEAERS